MTESLSARRFGYALLAFACVLAAGTVGFHVLLDEGWVSAFYRAVVTTTLTGLNSKPEGSAAELFSVALLFSGVVIFLYVAGVIVEAMARGVLGGAWAERRKRQLIEGLRNHYIICGYGRVGRRVAAEFREAGVDYVVLDFNSEALALAGEHGDRYLEGNATRDDDLHAAGLMRARGLVASSDSDVDNLYITLSARAARQDLLIVARAGDEDAAKKLRLAGADRVVQLYSTAGKEMATLVLKPQVAAFLDVASATGGPELRFEEIVVTRECDHAGRSIGELRVRAHTGALIIALRKRDGTFDTTPTAEATLDVGDVMIAVGTGAELRALEELFAPGETLAG